MHPEIEKYWKKYNLPIIESWYGTRKYFELSLDSGFLLTLAIFDTEPTMMTYFWWPDVLGNVSRTEPMNEEKLLRMIKLEVFA